MHWQTLANRGAPRAWLPARPKRTGADGSDGLILRGSLAGSSRSFSLQQIRRTRSWRTAETREGQNKHWTMQVMGEAQCGEACLRGDSPSKGAKKRHNVQVFSGERHQRTADLDSWTLPSAAESDLTTCCGLTSQLHHFIHTPQTQMSAAFVYKAPPDRYVSGGPYRCIPDTVAI